ncbi:hypothetical protein DFR50_103219 [Roseiarcus fermentans]|uniref:Uncharacterized protein n=1 Tax=Roseiarcus fermentans TaxID=1473586 RepID=A0A366FRP6_9HYPH|nr:hypothetical protein [Roseiarcus fermentans]RBP17332.1 hypothetical protein DFR50_103219 [Roseiarcus fermentans]
MLRAIMGSLAFLGAVSLAHADAPGPQPITQYETPAEAMWKPFSADLPTCDDAGVLSTISGRFAEAENTYWGGVNAVSGIDGVREIGFRANGLAYIPRRYCVGRAAVVDSRDPPPQRPTEHTVVYEVVAAGGIIGWSWGVQWCVEGFDRNQAYSPDCHVLRPILERWLGEQPAVVKARY